MLPRSHRMWIGTWCAWLMIPALIAYVTLTSQQRLLRQEMIERHAARMIVQSQETQRTPPRGHENDVASVVKIGAYVDRIPALSLVDSSWTADFYVWFTWEGADLNPGETFKVVNGEIVTRTLMRTTDNGNQHYALYRVTAQITKLFNVARFPRDEHLLTIALEDQAKQSYQLRYVTDDAASDISSRVVISGYRTVGKETVVKPHAYKTSLGDPTLPADYKATYSQFVLGISIERPSWSLFFKMFLATYLSIALAVAGLFVRGAPERLGLVATALFAAVVNGMSITSLIPDTGGGTLADTINGIAYVAIVQMVLQAILYHRFFSDPNKDAEAALVFDRSTFVLTSLLTVILNVAVLRAGM